MANGLILPIIRRSDDSNIPKWMVESCYSRTINKWLYDNMVYLYTYIPCYHIAIFDCFILLYAYNLYYHVILNDNIVILLYYEIGVLVY